MLLKIANAQTVEDIALLKQNWGTSLAPTKISTSSIIVSHNPLTFPFRWSLYFYQKIISPQWQTDCAHTPSCSNFAKQAIIHFGLLKGAALAADRLSRCSPLGLKSYRYYEAESTDGHYIDLPLYYYLH
jgi:putative component of membrane protein insertase Oxa1/YidC/SpoIIIJ protein YidD